jgi:hypothetical protein
MASVRNLTLSIVKDVANADVTVEYDIEFSSFDQNTNLQWLDACSLIGDDTNQDGDEIVIPGDDKITGGSLPTFLISAGTQTSLHRKRTLTLPFGNLNEDNFPGADGDDEIRAVVTLTPQLPTATSQESPVSLVNA